MMIAHALMFCAQQLDVQDVRNPWEWLCRLFFVSPRERAQHSHPLLKIVRQLLSVGYACLMIIAYILKLVWRAYRWLWQRASQGVVRLAPEVDVQALSVRMESWAQLPLLHQRLLVWATVALSLWMFFIVVTTPFSVAGQIMFLLVIWSAALLLRKIPGNLPTLIMIALSLIASCRYGWWRATETLDLETRSETILGTCLLLAEIYTWFILLLGYIQTAWPLKRIPVELPDDVKLWPTVDVFIPTYNEPLTVVKPTVLAAKGLDWPKDKIRIYLLDDGRRPVFKEFAEQAGIEYLIRPNNFHAKAGNLNHALTKTSGEYIAIFDCDHLPTRAFLQLGMGWFLRDPDCAMLQTPHHFFSADPFERNLATFKRVPNEGALFYGLIQDGNDLWNAAFFCGSCAIIKRAPLEEVGGIAVETVTEDAHTALKMHRRGYTTAYINIPMAAGLATDSLSGHVGQRIRWARGMAQIFRTDNPFLGKGLSLFQRICYSNAMLHFFYGIPRLIFLTAPLTFLYFEMHIIKAAASMIALYVLPHIIQSNLANSHMQGPHRHSFWAEVYETVLAWYITLPTTIAMFKPSAGTFNVTAKGGLIEHAFFDWTISKPYILLILVNFGGFLLGLVRLFYWNPDETGTVLLNMIWTVYNLLMLGAAIGVATEARQVRISHRVAARFSAGLRFKDGTTLACHTQDYSMTGLGLEVALDLERYLDELVKVSLWRGDDEYVFPARIIAYKKGSAGVRFENLDLKQEADLVQCTFARADAWTEWKNVQDHDHPMQGLKEITMLGLAGYKNLLSLMLKSLRDKKERAIGALANFGRNR